MNSDIGGTKQKHSKKICIGKIHADWCGHCVRLKPEWEKMKKLIKTDMGRNLKNTSIEFIDIGDTDENRHSGKTVDIMLEEFNKEHMSNSEQKLELDGGYPTVFKIHNGELEYYKGDRNAEEMYKWFTKQNGGSTKQNKNSRKKQPFRKTQRNKPTVSIFDCAKSRGKTQKKRGWFL